MIWYTLRISGLLVPLVWSHSSGCKQGMNEYHWVNHWYMGQMFSPFPPKTILVHDCEALKLVFKLLLVVCRFKNAIRYRNNVVTVSKYPWNLAIRAYQTLNNNMAFILKSLRANALLEGMKVEQMHADCGQMACSFGTPSFEFCYITQRLPSCFINLLGTTAGVTTADNWRISCLQI